MNENNIDIENLNIDTSIKAFFKDCIINDDFPNMLFYGNPGTGKTTTSSVLLKSYFSHKMSKKQDINIKQELNRNVLTMNASIYRNTQDFITTIKRFSQGTHLFCNNNYKKMIILDEIDYMTCHGQYSLIVLMKTYKNVVFICMCNYLSKLIDELKDYFLIFNYNCFGSIVKNYIINNNNVLTSKLLNYILSESDIREVNNEKYRINNMIENDKIKIIDIINCKINKVYKAFMDTDTSVVKINNIIIDHDLQSIELITGISSKKIELIILQNAYDKLTENDYKICNIGKLTEIMDYIMHH